MLPTSGSIHHTIRRENVGEIIEDLHFNSVSAVLKALGTLLAELHPHNSREKEGHL